MVLNAVDLECVYTEVVMSNCVNECPLSLYHFYFTGIFCAVSPVSTITFALGIEVTELSKGEQERL